MSKDPELSRLKSEMDRLFELKQSAYQEMKQAGEARTRAKDNLDASWERVESAREDMNSAFEDRQRDWDNFKSELARLSHTIDEASRNAEYYHERMKASYEEAHNAYEYGDRASAPGYSAEAQEYRELRDYHNEEKRALIDERRSLEKPSDTNFNYYKAVYERTKREHEREQSEYHAIKDAHERAKANFEDAKIAHANALSAFRARKEELKGGGNWSPIYGGGIGDKPVMVRFGKGSKAGQTLIADYHGQSNRNFNQKHRGHDHYGKDFATSRGQYTGPGH